MDSKHLWLAEAKVSEALTWIRWLHEELLKEALSTGQPITDDGPAAPGSGCTHEWMPFGVITRPAIAPGARLNEDFEMCRNCTAFNWSGVILVPAADPTSSTSQKPDLKQSAAPSYGAFAASQSNDSTEKWTLEGQLIYDLQHDKVDWENFQVLEKRVALLEAQLQADAVSTGGARHEGDADGQ